MSKLTRFEELSCWKNSRHLLKEIYALANNGELKRDFGLRDQVQRAAVSIMTNIAEGFARYHRKETIRFLDYAQSSASEIRSLLYVIEDLGYCDSEKAEQLRADTIEISKMVLGLIKHIKSKL